MTAGSSEGKNGAVLGLTDAEGLTLADTLAEGDALELGLTELDGDTLTDSEPEGDTEPLGLTLSDSDAEGLTLGDPAPPCSTSCIRDKNW